MAQRFILWSLSFGLISVVYSSYETPSIYSDEQGWARACPTPGPDLSKNSTAGPGWPEEFFFAIFSQKIFVKIFHKKFFIKNFLAILKLFFNQIKQ